MRERADVVECRYCKTLIDPRASKCPACSGNQPVPWIGDGRPRKGWGVLIAVPGILIVAVLLFRWLMR